MIANFHYEPRPLADCVRVQLFWDCGRRAAQIHVPSEIADELVENDWPVADGFLSIDGALAYGLMLSMRAGLALKLYGDRSVWPDEWGHLILSH